MKLSRDIRTTDLRDLNIESVRSQWVHGAETLERDLDAEHSRCMDLTARLDRARMERDDWKMTSRFWEERAYATLLVYEMREHARQWMWEAAVLSNREMSQRETRAFKLVDTARRLHRRAQAAESRATKAERQAEVQRRRADSEMAERRELHAALRRICSTDYDAAYDVARDVLAALPAYARPDAAPVDTRTGEGAREWAVGDACEMTLSDDAWVPAEVVGFDAPKWLLVRTSLGNAHINMETSPHCVRRPIPPTAMEPRIKGGRGLDAFGACPDMPEPCDVCQEAVCECNPEVDALYKRIAELESARHDAMDEAIADRDTRIANLEAEVAKLRGAAILTGNEYAFAGHEIDRQRVCIADLERRLREAEGQRDEARGRLTERECEVCYGTGGRADPESDHWYTCRCCDGIGLTPDYASLAARAERAEEKLRRVREAALHYARGDGGCTYAFSAGERILRISEESGT